MPEPWEMRLRDLFERAADRDDFASVDHIVFQAEVAHMRRRRTTWAAVAVAAVVIVLVTFWLGWLPGRSSLTVGPPPSGSAGPSVSAKPWSCPPTMNIDVPLPKRTIVNGAPQFVPESVGPLLPYQPLGAVVCRYYGLNQANLSGTLYASVRLSPEQLSSFVNMLNSLPPGALSSCPFDTHPIDLFAFVRPEGSISVIQRHRAGCQAVSDGVRYHDSTPQLRAMLDGWLGAEPDSPP